MLRKKRLPDTALLINLIIYDLVVFNDTSMSNDTKLSSSNPLSNQKKRTTEKLGYEVFR